METPLRILRARANDLNAPRPDLDAIETRLHNHTYDRGARSSTPTQASPAATHTAPSAPKLPPPCGEGGCAMVGLTTPPQQKTPAFA